MGRIGGRDSRWFTRKVQEALDDQNRKMKRVVACSKYSDEVVDRFGMR